MTQWLASFHSGHPLGHPSQPTDGRSSCLADPVVSSGACKVHTVSQALGLWFVSLLPEPGLGNPPQACRLQSILGSHAAWLVTTNKQNPRDGRAVPVDKVKGSKGNFIRLSFAKAGQECRLPPCLTQPHQTPISRACTRPLSSLLRSIGSTLETTHPLRQRGTDQATCVTPGKGLSLLSFHVGQVGRGNGHINACLVWLLKEPGGR